MHHDVKLLTFFALTDQEFARLEPFFMDGISKLVALISIHVLKDAYFLKELFVFLTLVLCAVFHNMVKSSSVKGPKLSWCICHNSCSSGCVIKQSQFTERFARYIFLQERWLGTRRLQNALVKAKETYEYFRACESTLLDNIQVVSIFALFNNILTSRKADFLHGTKHNLKFLRIQG